MHAFVHSASVGPICMREWLPSGHMSSVMTPVKTCFSCAAERAVTRNRLSSTGFIMIRDPEGLLLFSRHHQVGCAGPGVHNPDTAHLAVVRQAHRLRGRPGN